MPVQSINTDYGRIIEHRDRKHHNTVVAYFMEHTVPTLYLQPCQVTGTGLFHKDDITHDQFPIRDLNKLSLTHRVDTQRRGNFGDFHYRYSR